ncbi:MAG: hypothetical protein GEU95_23195 [Rhizobiales bacterium]|nr:hypothetical protein [Hyphomicrobiales bacterium]
MKRDGNGKAKHREERLQIMLAPEELSAVDTFRFSNRMPSRAAAVRELIRRGLTAVGVFNQADNSKSRDYGVLSSPTTDGDAKSAGS